MASACAGAPALKYGYVNREIPLPREVKGLIKEYDWGKSPLIFEGEYLNGKRNGKGKEYDWYGRLRFEGEYLNGKRIWKRKRILEQ